ncbi:hypothetical protein BC940DRAFT_240615 [Gongronella butleri]|nr:hypothetical protein BC940DRAFT_240615 [Gongronella butleri]
MANDISENETLHIVASLESLVPLVELASSLGTTFRIPLRVAQHGDHTTLFFDAPVPNHTWSAKQRNQLVFDWAWKAAVLNWPQAISVDTKLTQTQDDTTTDSEWHHDTDENHTYNMWRFGDMNVLIRHQVDGFLSADGGKRHCMMSTKLDYQHQNGTDEVTTATERAVNWLRSFVAGHAIVLEARVDVPNGRVYHVHKKNMADIMGDKWRPMQESNMLHYLFHQLHR